MMFFSKFLALTFLFALANCEAEPEVEKGVYVLTTGNFDDFISAHPFVFVEFYAPWCGHCKSLAPIYESVANQIQDQKFGDKEVVLAKVDATVESDLATRFEIEGYPALKWFADGKAFDYDRAGREEQDLIDFIAEHSDPSWEPPKSVVIDLAGGNFSEFINNNDLSLIEFYAPWCGHCKRLAPVYEKAAKRLMDRTPGPPIPLARVDATAPENKDLAQKYDITGYPTLKVFRKDRVFDFNQKGQPDEHSIVGYMEKQAMPASRLIEDKKTFKKALNDAADDMVVVGFFESENDQFFKTYNDAANELRDEDMKFTHVFGKDSWADYDVTKSMVTVYVPPRFQTKYEPKRHEFTNGDAKRFEIVDFIISNSVPMVGHYTYSTRDKRYAKRRPLCLFFYTVDFSHDYRDSTQKWRRKIADIANDFRDITFAIANDDEFESVMQELGLGESSEEMNVGCYDAKGTKYPLDPPMEEWSDKHVRSYLKKMKKGELKPYYKSQAIPKGNRAMDGKVHVVVGNTFESIVMNSEKDVLLFIYAPWCGHCKNFAPQYKKLAEDIIPKEGKNLILAKIDATANDVPPSYMATGFPTLYFAPAGSKGLPFKYEGNRTPEDIIMFMKKHSAKAFIAEKKEEL